MLGFHFLSTAQAGLSLVYVTETIDLLQFTVQQSSDVENQMTSFYFLFYLEAFTKLNYILQTFITDTRARMRGQRTDTKSRRGKPRRQLSE